MASLAYSFELNIALSVFLISSAVAKIRGAKVIVLDPRISDQAQTADLHLRLKAGTDAAMCLGWLNVIINEQLYDVDLAFSDCTFKKYSLAFMRFLSMIKK